MNAIHYIGFDVHKKTVPAVSDIGRMPLWAGQAWPPATICFPHQGCAIRIELSLVGCV
jgi:hypothetical protein